MATDKKAKLAVFFTGVFGMAMAGCGQAVREEELIQQAVLSKAQQTYYCQLVKGENGNVKQTGITASEAWLNAASQVQNHATFGLMNQVYIDNNLVYDDILEFASALQQTDITFPALSFYALQKDPLQKSETVKGYPLTDIMNSSNALLLPTADGESCFLYQKTGSRQLSGAAAQAAMLLAGESKALSVVLLSGGSEWRLESSHVSWFVQKEKGRPPQLCVQVLFAKAVCLQSGQQMNSSQQKVLAAELENVFRHTIELTGPEVYGIPTLLRQQDPDADLKDSPIEVSVYISNTL